MEPTLTIDGRPEASARSFPVINPANETILCHCPDATPEQLDRAVDAAARSFRSWRQTDRDVRRRGLETLAEKLSEQQEEFARTLTLEQGKPLAAARGEVGRAAQILRITAAFDAPVEVLEDSERRRVEVRYEPLGVVGAITPWNAPLLLAAGKVAAALITGNTVIVKPSPYTPVTTLRLGELARDILPPGVLSVLTGDDSLGKAMTEHQGIQQLTFTGSVPTGKAIVRGSADKLAHVTLELGGNDPAIVLEDVDLDHAALPLFWAAFRNSGQICVAIKRLYVQAPAYDAVCEALTRIANDVRLGDGLDSETTLGPIQNAAQFVRVVGILEDTLQTDARILTGGTVPDRPGYFVPPTLVADIAEGTRLVDEEPFGPILPIIRFADVDEAVERANRTVFGLGASVWTRDVERGAEIAARLEAGSVWVNQHGALDPAIPFGGVKQSGQGFVYSAAGLKEYLDRRVIHVARSKASHTGIPPRDAVGDAEAGAST
jgi:acyl-CoA reductase-like NAD-dependent aldehyde dehydrogenase